MKKLLALLLSAIILCSFGVGANAAPPDELLEEGLEAQIISAAAAEDLTQEELDALGRELLMQTMEDLRGDYTIYWYESIVHSDGKFVVLYGDSVGTYELHLENEVLCVYPNRNLFEKWSKSRWSARLQLLKPKEITADTQISVTQSDGHIYITYDGIRYSYDEENTFYYVSGKGLGLYARLSKEADLSLFSLEGMREMSALRIWLRDFFNKFLNLLFLDMQGAPIGLFLILLWPILWPFILMLWKSL